MLDVSYEDVVDDLEGQARRLIDYCGLPWDDRCIDFHETPGRSRQPVPFRSASPCSAARCSAGAGTRMAWGHCWVSWEISYPAMRRIGHAKGRMATVRVCMDSPVWVA